MKITPVAPIYQTTNHKSNNKQTNDKKKKPKNTETVGFHLPNNS